MATTSVQDTSPLFYHIGRRFPPELKRLICSYMPISVLRKVRKIRQCELPNNYKIAKALNDHFYMVHYGYKLDMMSCQNRLHYFEKQLLYTDQRFMNSFNINDCYNLTSKKLEIQESIKECEESMILPTLLYTLYKEPYDTSTLQLEAFNIIETD
jgi:hypothetical protein